MASPLSYVPTSYIPVSLKNSPLNQLSGMGSAVDGIKTKISAAIPGDYESLKTDFDKLSSKNQSDNNFKVRLVSILDMVKSSYDHQTQVIFQVTPTINETGSVEYTPIQPVHMPGGIQVYKFTSSRTFEINAHFITRSVGDAIVNMRNLQTLRSWRMPFFGKSTTDISPAKNPNADSKLSMDQIKNDKNNKGINLLGAPPEVLYLYGYSPVNRVADGKVGARNINRVPVVITNLSISYPEDVDYIPVSLTPGSTTESFPVKMDVTISLLETHSPAEYETFNLSSYKSGTLVNF